MTPKVPSSTGIFAARPTGFEPLTFGSVADAVGRDLAQQSQIRALRSPKSRQKFRIAATIHRVVQLAGRAAWDAYSYGERAYDPPHVRHLLLVLSRRVAD